MTGARINIRIRRVTTTGLERLDRQALTAALERQLARRLAQTGLAADLTSAHTAALPTVATPTAGTESIGAQVARAIHTVIGARS